MNRIYIMTESKDDRTMRFMVTLSANIVKFTIIAVFSIFINTIKEIISLNFIKNKASYGIITLISFTVVFLNSLYELLVFTPFVYFILVGGVIGSIKDKYSEYNSEKNQRSDSIG